MQKKKKLLTLPTKYNIAELTRRITIPFELTRGSYKKIEFRFIDNSPSVVQGSVDLREFSNVWLSSTWGNRDLAYAVKLYLDHHRVAHTYVEKTTSKITDQMLFALNNIAIPNTFFVDNTDIQEYVEIIERICGYPLIIKDTEGARGKNSSLILNRKKLISESRKLSKSKKFFFQSYIPNDYDWGILVANGKVVSAEKSYPKAGEFRNNVGQGGTEVFSPLDSVPSEIKEIAVRAAKALKLNWSRADILVDKNTQKAYLMEVNRFPCLTSGTSEIEAGQGFLENFLGAD